MEAPYSEKPPVQDREAVLEKVRKARMALEGIDERFSELENLRQIKDVECARYRQAHKRSWAWCFAIIGPAVDVSLMLIKYLPFEKHWNVLIASVVAGAGVLGGMFLLRSILKKNDKAEEKAVHMENEYGEDIRAACEEFARFTKENEQHVNLLPEEYRTAETAKEFEDMLENGLADDLDGCIDRYEYLQRITGIKQRWPDPAVQHRLECQQQMVSAVNRKLNVANAVVDAIIVYEILKHL